MSADSKYVVYRTDQDTTDVYELYSVPITGGTSTKLNGILTPDGNVFANNNFQISPDSSRVVYVADQDADDVLELYSVPITGGYSAKLNGILTPGGNVFAGTTSSFQISPDSSRVVYVADQDTDDIFELYSVPITGDL